MPKKYCDYIDEITADELYEGLLGYGMFANKLPPVFTSESFFRYCLKNTPSYSVKEWHDYVSYTSMRNVNIPRTFGIPTPMKYQCLCIVLRDNWDKLRNHFHQQTDGQAHRVSRIHLRKLFENKSLFEMNYRNWQTDGNPEVDLLFSKSNGISKFVVKADISTCFPSIYSHSLPWALVGKGNAKVSCKEDSLWYNKIDAACYTMKNGETHGLLIGPFASNLLSEIILTKVDKKLYDMGYRYFRNIDDYECYVCDYKAAQCFLKELESALREYDLPLNHKKTAILPLPVSVAETWTHKLNSFIAIKQPMTYRDVNAYLDLAHALARETGDSAVLKYAIKVLSKCDLPMAAKQLAARRLLHMSVVYPYLVHVLEEHVIIPFAVEKDLIKEWADAIYTDSEFSHNYEAISYAIYFSLKYDFILGKVDIDWVIQQGDCVLLLMTWLYYLKMNHSNVRANQLKPLKVEAKRLFTNDMDRYWLFCYEVLSSGNLKGEWKQLKQAGVSFVRAV